LLVDAAGAAASLSKEWHAAAGMLRSVGTSRVWRLAMRTCRSGKTAPAFKPAAAPGPCAPLRPRSRLAAPLVTSSSPPSVPRCRSGPLIRPRWGAAAEAGGLFVPQRRLKPHLRRSRSPRSTLALGRRSCLHI
jgi:hypothetical protein